MQRHTRFSIIIAEATLITTLGFLTLMLVLFFFRTLKLEPSRTLMWVLLLVAYVLLPIGAAVWWIFPRLATIYPRREARAVTMAFGLFSPVALGVGIVLGQPIGGFVSYPEPLVVVVSVFLAATTVATALLLAVCALVLRVTRLAISVESTH